MHARAISRRTLLGGLAASVGAIGLAGCGPDSSEPGAGPGSSSGGTAVAPAYVPFDGVTPDKPGTAEGVSPVFYNYPNPPINRDGFPLPEGESFTALMQGGAPKVSPAESKNYQQAYEQLGTEFDIIYGGWGQNYIEKFQVTMAGGDIPDMAMIVSVAQLPKLLETHFADLSEHLGGDGIKKYPGLANIPTPSWKVPSLNGRIWGVPQPRPPAGMVLTSRGDTFAKRGIDDPNLKLRDGNDFLEMLDQLTDKGKGEFAMGADPLDWLIRIVKTMVGTPNQWSENGGTFTHENESEEMKEALSQSAKIIKAGYLHPNSFSDPSQNKPWFVAGTTALYVQSFVGWGTDARVQPDWNVGNIELPKWEGGGMAPIHLNEAGYVDYVAFKKADDARIEQLLQVADYIASPFGTQQYLNVNYGVDGYSYRMEGGDPVGMEDAPKVAWLTYAGSNSKAVLYGEGVKESVDAQYDYLSRALPDGIDNPALGLYSETEGTKAATMLKTQRDVMREVMQGTKPMSAWEDFVKRWKTDVGDTMAAEYAEAAASQ